MQTLKHMLGFIDMNSPIKVIYYYFKREMNMKRNLHLELSKINATIISIISWIQNLNTLNYGPAIERE